jgi:succinyl-CoA synthetase alpha subunit
VIFVPARFASAAMKEAADGGIRLVVCITEGVPVMEMVENYAYIRKRGVRLIGPNCPGLISPGKSKVGIMPGPIHAPGNIGVISRSGTLTYEVVYNLTSSGLGQSTGIGIGGDPIIGTGYIELLEMFERDPDTHGVVIIGEIGGDDEERAAEYIGGSISKPVVAFISGRTAPPGKRMGHAEAKVRAFEEASVPVADRPDQIPELMRERL